MARSGNSTWERRPAPVGVRVVNARPLRYHTGRDKHRDGQQQEGWMAISERLKAFLQASRISYTTARHPVVYTAQEIAAAQHVSGRQLAKCVLVKTDRGPVLAVLPAVHLLDFKTLKGIL